jgi:hypothetical protein
MNNVSLSRRASEKVKKGMKLADLKAFVETKLLSKSEKTLEKIGHDDNKAHSMFEQVNKLNYVFCFLEIFITKAVCL